MRTVTLELYKFDELSEEAQQKAIENYRRNGVDTSHIYDEAHNTVTAFHSVFGTEEGCDSWLDVYTDHIETRVCELKGLRLRKYILNNFGDQIITGKYYGKLVDTFKDGTPIPKSMEYPIGRRHLKRYSKVIFERSCPLTGVCYDMSILKPIYDLIDWNNPEYHSELTFEELIEDCFRELKNDLESEAEYMESDEAIREAIEANDYEYTEDGTEH